MNRPAEDKETLLKKLHSSKLHQFIQSAFIGAEPVYREQVQSLWSGYGTIARFDLGKHHVRGHHGEELCNSQSVIVKMVVPHFAGPSHPRGWKTSLSHQRKLKSYQVEGHWYEFWANQCPSICRVPTCYGIHRDNDEVWILLEDLDAVGYPKRSQAATALQIDRCLHWLAHFHAHYLQTPKPQNLWPIGTYWHLDTRPDEWNALKDQNLKHYAEKFDAILNATPFRTLVHGDAKIANFCFSDNDQRVAAVDFQYIGSGCGMKDVAYFIGSALPADDCQLFEDNLLNNYFRYLKDALTCSPFAISSGLSLSSLYQQLEDAWRPLYCVAWADFMRFIKGWSPNHQKIHSYSEKQCQKAFEYCNQ